MLNLTTKERMLLEDQKSHEEICIQKYTTYESQAQDQQLKQILNANAQSEKEHLNSINQLLSGNIPSLNQENTQQNANNTQSQATAGNVGMNNANDAKICQDLLMTEKYVSGTYDTSIFEFTNTNVRDVLNHIQKEEQKHGEAIYQYMESKGMYHPK